MPTTEVILTEKIASLGAEADVVKVKQGYARNFLVPNGKALEVTPAALRRINQLKAKRAEREARELNEAEELGRRVNKIKLTVVLETAQTGRAFGSITAKDLADKLAAEHNIEVDRHKIELERPIKEIGTQEITVRLHSDVTAKFQLTVESAKVEAAEGDEAESED